MHLVILLEILEDFQVVAACNLVVIYCIIKFKLFLRKIGKEILSFIFLVFSGCRAFVHAVILSLGGERSFSTLCFTLALHGMTEAPFRAMDEFDVFMDAVSRKISLDTLVDFAAAQGSQWIFITPHDISMVKAGDRIKKQQMAAPRG